MAKIAISLPDEVLEAVEKERLAKGESRSQFFRRAAEEQLRREKDRKDIEQYIRAYQMYPETKEEIALAEAFLKEVWADNPWEDEPDK